MIARYDATPEDLTYVYRRTLERARRGSSLARQALFMAALGALIFGALAPPGAVSRSIAATAGAAFSVALWIPARRRITRRTIQRIVAHQCPPGEVIPVTVELTDVGIVAATPEGASTIEWRDVAVVEEAPDSIDIWTVDAELLAVVKRAFDDDAGAAFLDAARHLHQQAIA